MAGANVFYGDRGEAFKSRVADILKLASVPPELHAHFMEKPQLDLLGQALTHPSADIVHNYELLEFLGDATVNTAIVYYMARRFDNIAHTRSVSVAVKVLARLKINMTSKRSLAQLANMLALFPFVSAEAAFKENHATKLAEDTFEAFAGAMTLIADNFVAVGAGYACVYRLVEALFGRIDIDLSYESLFDARTRLKEIGDVHRELGAIVIKTTPSGHGMVARAYLKPHGTEPRVLLGEGEALGKGDAIQTASAQAIHTLRFTYGVYREPAQDYMDLHAQ